MLDWRLHNSKHHLHSTYTIIKVIMMKMVTDDRKANVSLLKHGHVVPPITDRCRQVGWVGTCPDRCSGDHYVMILIIKVVVMIRLMVITVVVNSHDVE